MDHWRTKTKPILSRMNGKSNGIITDTDFMILNSNSKCSKYGLGFGLSRLHVSQKSHVCRKWLVGSAVGDAVLTGGFIHWGIKPECAARGWGWLDMCHWGKTWKGPDVPSPSSSISLCFLGAMSWAPFPPSRALLSLLSVNSQPSCGCWVLHLSNAEKLRQPCSWEFPTEKATF